VSCFDAQGYTLPCPPGVPDGSLTSGSLFGGPSTYVTPQQLQSAGVPGIGPGNSQAQTSPGLSGCGPGGLIPNTLCSSTFWKDAGLILAGGLLVVFGATLLLFGPGEKVATTGIA